MKRIFVVLLSALMILTMIPAVSFGAALPFTDVAETDWYYSDVQRAYETGLINGMDATTFAPESHMTYAQAVKLAACMHQKYTTGHVILQNGSPDWWDSYVEYATVNHIINKEYDWNSTASRAGYVEIFAHALPDSALQEKNEIPDDSVPDVKMSHPQSAEIYRLYRAGILTGTGTEGHFEPDNSIKRSEVSAILTRMMNQDARKTLVLGPTFSVRFNSNGGSSVPLQVVPENGKAVRPANPVKEGAVFVKWCSDSSLHTDYDFNTPVTRNLMLYAVWGEPSKSFYEVRFQPNGGYQPPAQMVGENEKVSEPEAPVRNGYLFKGWYSDGEMTSAYDFSSPVTEGLTLYAKWECTIADSWEQIIASVNDGTYREKYQVGDTKTLDLGPEGIIEMQIVAFDADERADGQGKAAITWIAVQPLKTEHRMNPLRETISRDPLYENGTGAVGGWPECEMRIWLKEYVKPLIPDPVRGAILPVTKYNYSMNQTGNGVKDVASTDEIWIPSSHEIFGKDGSETKGPDYSSFFSVEENRIKYKSPGMSDIRWWLRTARESREFWLVSRGQGTSLDLVSAEFGVVLGFCM